MEAESNMTGARVEVSVSLRAFVLTVSAASAAVAIRMAERWRRYEQYSPFWQVRPRVSSVPPAHSWPWTEVDGGFRHTLISSKLKGMQRAITAFTSCFVGSPHQRVCAIAEGMGQGM